MECRYLWEIGNNHIAALRVEKSEQVGSFSFSEKLAKWEIVIVSHSSWEMRRSVCEKVASVGIM